ncbi:MAG: Ig-like domain-containing protein [Synechococcaceae cyanobacterium]
MAQAQPDGPALSTHTDLTTQRNLASIAIDQEGDPLFWRVVSASHGSARLGDDGQTLLFSPEAGYSGNATIVVQADDGFNASAPIELAVKVSGAKLLAIRLQPLPNLLPGQSAVLRAVGIFEDAAQVDLSVSGDYLHLEARDLSPLGYVGANAIRVDDSQDRVRAEVAGAGLIVASRTDAAGRTINATAAVNVGGLGEEEDQIINGPEVDVYPNTLSLAPGGTRQLKVWTVDANSGERIEIHTEQQIRRAAQPETSETFTDPDTGETFTLVLPATTQLSSGTRYFSSDESVATISADGLITAKGNGVATISVVHLGTDVDPYGSLKQQAIGQTLISLKVQVPQLTDNDPATPTPDRISVGAEAGGIVAAATGETVLIGPGALKAATAVGLQRRAVDNIETITGLAAPAAGVLLPVAAFRLDLGAEATNEPVQLRIPVQVGSDTATPGEEVLFFRKGQVLQPDGQWHDTWWLLDNGVIETDASGQLVARTASRPYEGMTRSGDYMISRRSPGMMDTFEFMNIAAGTWASFGVLGFSMGGGLSGFSAFSSVLGILASQATALVAGRYAFGLPKFADIELPQSGLNNNFELDTAAVLPAVQTPFGNVSLPKISRAEVGSSGQILFTVEAPSADLDGQTPLSIGQLVVRAVMANGSHRDVLSLPGSTSGQISVPPPDDLAIGSVSWQLVRQIPTGTIGSDGELILGDPLEFEGNQIKLRPKADMAAVLTRTGITIVRQEDDPVTVPLLELVKGPGEGQSDFSTYLTGRKVQPVAFSDDLSRIYVGGNGVVYVVDTLSLKKIATITIPDGRSITSLATAGDLLLIGEAAFGNGSRLLAMSTNPGNSRYHQAITIQGAGLEASPLGVSDICIGPDGKTMVVALPKQNPSYTLAGASATGDVLIFSLDSLNRTSGRIDAPIVAFTPADSISGKSPQMITATSDPNRYLLTNINDYNRGLSALVIQRDDNMKPLSAAANSILMQQPGTSVQRDRLNIQRAQSAVLVTAADGVEYAIVSDDNYNFLDPYWRAMFEAPMFTQTSPYGPPTAVGGAASAKKVNVGGKLGIVKDPFGLRGAPQYLGATVPLDGYGIVNLSLSEDGKTLIGQLKGGYGTIDQNTQLPHESQVWDVNALIAAAIAQPESDRLAKPFVLPTNAGQRIPTNGAAPAGTEFEQQGSITLLDPINRNSDIDGLVGSSSRPIFKLKSSQDLEELRIFVSVFGPGDGLFPDDRPKHIASEWSNQNARALDEEHSQRIFTSSNLLLPGQKLRAGEIFPYRDFAIDPNFANFRLTPGQTLWWGAEGKQISGGEVSARAAAQFQVGSAFQQGLPQASSVTIITHGFQPPLPGADNDPAMTRSAELARILAQQQNGYVYKYDRQNGAWTPLDGDFISLNTALEKNHPVVLVPDWIIDSGLSDSGFSEAAADALYASLIEANAASGGKLLSGYLHLIAHSRGAVVNSELSQRLLWYARTYGIGRPLDLHVTTLDPHDQNQDSLILEGRRAQLANTLGANTVGGVTANLLLGNTWRGLDRIDYSEFYDPNVQAWEGVNYADNYYQHIANENLPSVTLTPNGRSLAGADSRYQDNGFDFDFDLSGMKGFIFDDNVKLAGVSIPISSAIVHSRPHSWYGGTIDLSLDYFSPMKTRGGDPVDQREPIIRRKADYASDQLPSVLKSILTAQLTAQSPYTDAVSPWYLQRVDERSGRVIRGSSGRSGLVSVIDSYNSEILDTWEGIGVGWAMSALGGGIPSRINAGSDKRIPLTEDNTEFGISYKAIPSVFNGDFQASVRPFFGRYPTRYELPGWSFHNGNQESVDMRQSHNLAFLGLDRERMARDSLQFNSTNFDRLLNIMQMFKGDNFSIDDLANAVLGIQVALELGVNVALRRVPGLSTNFLLKLLSGFAVNNAVVRPLVIAELAEFASRLSKYADWGYQLNGTSELTHNRMILPISADQLSFEVTFNNSPPINPPQSPEDPYMVIYDTAGHLIVEILTGENLPPTVLGRINITDLPEGSSQYSLVIPQGVRSSQLQSLQLRFRLEVPEPVLHGGNLIVYSGNVVIDDVRVGSTFSVRDSSENPEDQIVLFSDGYRVPLTTSPEMLIRHDIFVLPGQNEHNLNLKNNSDSAILYDVSVSKNSFLFSGIDGGRVSAYNDTQQKRTFLSNQSLPSRGESQILLSVGLSDSLRKEYSDNYDAVLLSTDLFIDTRKLAGNGSYVGAGGSSVKLLYFTELSDLNHYDSVLNGRDIVAGQTGLIKIYNPNNYEIALVPGSRWRLSTDGPLTLLSLASRRNDDATFDGNLEIRINGQHYRDLVVRSRVVPRQQLLVDDQQLSQLLFDAITAALTPTDQLESLPPEKLRLHTLIASSSFRARFEDRFELTDLEAIMQGTRRSFGSSENLGIFSPAFWDSTLDILFSSPEALSPMDAARTTAVQFVLEPTGNSIEAGSAGWDFNQALVPALLLNPDGSFRTDLGARAKAYALSRLLNTNLTGASFSATSSSGSGQARISIPNALKQAAAFTSSVSDRPSRMIAIGNYLGWLIAHELAHNIGLPDEYKLDSSGQRIPLHPSPSFMGVPNDRRINIEQRDLLSLALRHQRDIPPERIDKLLRYIIQLSGQRPYQGSPPLNTGEFAENWIVTAPEQVHSDVLIQPEAPAETSLISFLNAMGLINPTLLNPDFGIDGTDGWITEGDLRPGSNTITLKESLIAPTHLAQIFQINSGDRQLRFTVADLSLDANSAGPNDAFEVALLNADTTLPALGADGTVPLPDADALLNIQPSGAPSLASALRWSANGDGSTTYSLDLPDSLVGTAVLLSFDLIGFGAADSQVTLRDISLSGSRVASPSLMLVNDTGSSASDRLTADGTVSVSGLVSGATWQFSSDGGSSWSASQTAATSSSFVVPSGSYGLGQVQVRQSLGGSTSEPFTSFAAFTVDTLAPQAPTLSLANDTGFSSADRLTADGSLTISGVEASAVWQVSSDGGTTWSVDQSPATSSFLLAPGSYSPGQVQLRQRDAAGNTSAPLSSFEALTVDLTPPTGSLSMPGAAPVAPVRSTTANGTYGLGSVITLTLEFSEPVHVDTSGGSPTLQLETGAMDRFASYSGGSGTTTLSFTYVVQLGDLSADLDQLSSSSLALNGATIQDGAGNNALLSLAAPGAPGSLSGNADLVIDAFNHAPTDLLLSNLITSLPETTNTTNAIRLADIHISDDEFGTNLLSLVGADANAFELKDKALYLKAGTALNYEGSQNTYSLSVQVADASVVGATPISKPYSLALANVNEAPNSLGLSSTNFDENIPMDSRIASLSATDPDLPFTPQTFT